MEFWQTGDMRVARVEEMCSPGFPPGLQFPDYDPAIFEGFPGPRSLDGIDRESGRTIAGIRGRILWAGEEIVVIDTATENGKTRANPRHARFHMLDTAFIPRLTDAGAAPGDVTMVINTHMHVDHPGRNTEKRGGDWVPTFPNARHVFGREEYRNWQPGGVNRQVARDHPFRPVLSAGALKLLEGLRHHLDPGGLMNPGSLGRASADAAPVR